MATNFPTSLDSLTNPSSGDSLASPSHAAQHANVNDAVEALQAKVGVDGSAVTTSLDYKVAQQGLTLVKSQTIGSGVASVTVTDAFSSTFENYRIVWRVALGSAATQTNLLLGSATANYKYSFYAPRWNGLTFTNYNSAGTYFYVGATYNTSNAGSGTIDLLAPNLAAVTHMMCSSVYGGNNDGWSAHGAGIQTDTTQFTSFTLDSGAGTWTGGEIFVYGYNNG